MKNECDPRIHTKQHEAGIFRVVLCEFVDHFRNGTRTSKLSGVSRAKVCVFLCFGVILSIALTTFAQSSGGTLKITSSVVGGSSGAGSGGTLTVQGSAGQTSAGSAQGSTLSVAGGVWPTTSIGPVAAPGTISGVIVTDQGVPLGGVTIILSGSDSRKTITDANGRYEFDGVTVNLQYTVTPSLVDFSFNPAIRSFTLAGVNTNATFTATANGDHLNPLDTSEFFVRQHYLDFLNREPDQSGFNFWSNQIISCGSDQQCADVTRVNVSGAFFLSIEFQQTGYLVERFYKVAYGDAAGNSTFGGNHTLAVPIVRFNELLPDTQQIGKGVVVLQPGWQQALENNKQAFASQFVQRPRFIAAFPSTMTPAQFADKLNQNAGNAFSSDDRAALIALFGSASDTSNLTARAQVVRQAAENTNLYNAEFNRAFVLMQYLGYLRRNANDPPDMDYTGYDFWLTKLNQFNGNFIQAEMVKAFITSTEYRRRFGP
jgi:carboxypeptidase family protein/uncharacterized protein DUF4214